MTTRLLFLDRDGTLNRTIGRRPPDTPDEVELLPGVEAVLSRFAGDGWQLVIVTNQGGVASGYLAEAQAHAVQQRLIELLPVPVAASYLCPHMPEATVPQYAVDCPNRKPRPGFIHMALQALGARAEDCLFVGDSITDREAAEAAKVPFRWADRFFGRPIRRGVRVRDGQWIRLREAAPADVETMLDLVGRIAGQESASLYARALSEAWSGQEQSGSRKGDGSAPRDLHLLAVRQEQIVGWLALLRGRSPVDAHTVDLTFGVNATHRDVGIGSLLMETGLEWAGWQSGLERICVQVAADNVPVPKLCCKFGFTEEGRRTERGRDEVGDGYELISLACYL